MFIELDYCLKQIWIMAFTCWYLSHSYADIKSLFQTILKFKQTSKTATQKSQLIETFPAEIWTVDSPPCQAESPFKLKR
jgi:hypothetical protein